MATSEGKVWTTGNILARRLLNSPKKHEARSDHVDMECIRLAALAALERDNRLPSSSICGPECLSDFGIFAPT